MRADGQSWRKVPLYYAIIDILERKGGNAKDIEIYRTLREEYYDVTYSEFLKALMILEMQDIVYVEMIREDLRTVKLLRKP